MKSKKDCVALQAKARSGLVWPSANDQIEFDRFSEQVKTLVFANLPSVGSAAKTWDYDPYEDEWYFEVEEMLACETKPGVTRRATVTSLFHVPRASVCDDLELTINMVGREIVEWRQSLHEMRKLQLNRVLTMNGQEAYLAAVDRGL